MISLFNILRYLTKLSNSRMTVAVIAILGLVSGAAQAGLVALVNKELNNGSSSTASLLILFIALCVGLPGSRFVSQWLMTNLTRDTFRNLRLELSKRILNSPQSRLDELGKARLVDALMHDVTVIVNTLSKVPVVAMHCSLVIILLIYLGWLSPRLVTLLLGMIAIGGVSYFSLMRRGQLYHQEAMERRKDLVQSIEELVAGSKELKMNCGRRKAFLAELNSTAWEVHQLGALQYRMISLASVWGQTLFFVAVGLILFLAPGVWSVDKGILVSYSIVIFLLMAPLEVILNTIPYFHEAFERSKNIESLELSASASDSEMILRLESMISGLELLEMAYCYNGSTHSQELGPITLQFEPGKIVFIVGASGSGKTTLAKLLVGLFAPTGGGLLYDRLTITEENRARYREMFSVIFSDGHVFASFLGVGDELKRPLMDSYLEKLRLKDKVRIEGHSFSSISLSQGERKRLALCAALLEDRPFFLFDEWAAGQDPSFKDFFYRSLLIELRENGKTIFVVSHDDKYLDIADRVLTLEKGRIVRDETITK